VVENLEPDAPWHFTAFHPHRRRWDIPPTPAGIRLRVRAIARKNGVCYAFIGNVHDPAS